MNNSTYKSAVTKVEIFMHEDGSARIDIFQCDELQNGSIPDESFWKDRPHITSINLIANAIWEEGEILEDRMSVPVEVFNADKGSDDTNEKIFTAERGKNGFDKIKDKTTFNNAPTAR